MLGIINRGVSYKFAEVISKLYRSYVRPHLECCFKFWTPTNVKDADMLKGVTENSNQNDSKIKKPIIRGNIEKFGYVFSKT